MSDNRSVQSSEIVTAEKFKFGDLINKEDWLAIWIGFIIIAAVTIGLVSGAYDLKAANFSTWGDGTTGFLDIFNGSVAASLLLTFVILALLFGIGTYLQKKSVSKFLPAFLGLFVITTVVRIISAQVIFSRYLEFAFWALVLGLIIANTIKTPNWLKPALQTEFYIKAGLVTFGAEVLFSNIRKFGLYGLGIAWIVTPIVIIFMWFLGTRILKIKNKELVITIATATSVCGTSAAIAVAAASKAKKTDLTFAVGISLIFTVIMMVLFPIFIKVIGLNELMGGAWIGGAIDSTGAVTLAGAALGELGQTSATLVKMIQNILIGFVAFAVAIFFTSAENKAKSGNEKSSVGIGEIWHRFPKFILGFLAASVFTSFIAQNAFGADTTSSIISNLGQFRTWAFALAFTSIGLETNFGELKEQFAGGKPVTLYVVGQLFNIVLTFAAVWILLSGTFFPVPVLQ